MAAAAGSTSYGNQIAAAAAEVVAAPKASARIFVGQPASASATAQVKPETPAPTTAIRLFTRLI